MSAHHDVHVCPDPGSGRWIVTQGGKTLSRHLSQATAVQAGRRAARRAHAELVTHGRDGRIRDKDSYGRDSATPDAVR
jgi:hypothetical protein